MLSPIGMFKRNKMCSVFLDRMDKSIMIGSIFDIERGREREGEKYIYKEINDQVASLSLLPLELLNMDENFSEKHQRFVQSK